eukprot:scaffold16706_cov153-Amphora_coffeaeformis.AAC.3
MEDGNITTATEKWTRDDREAAAAVVATSASKPRRSSGTLLPQQTNDYREAIVIDSPIYGNHSYLYGNHSYL